MTGPAGALAPEDRATFADTGHDFEADGHAGPVNLNDYDGQTVTIIRQLAYETEVDPEVGPMYAVRASDGVEFDAFEDELTREVQA